jgi:hypothetical protein
VAAVQARQVHRHRVGTQCAFAAQVVVVLKVTERQFAKRAVDRRAEAQAREIRLGNASPQAAFAVEGHHVIVVTHALQIHEQRRVAVETQSGSGQQRSLQAVSFALAQYALRRPRRVRVLILQRVNELLDSRRVFSARNTRKFFAGKPKLSRLPRRIPFLERALSFEGKAATLLESLGNYTEVSSKAACGRCSAESGVRTGHLVDSSSRK